MRSTVDQINADAASGPPEGVPAKALLILIDPDGGRSMAITLFETEDDLRAGDAALNEMTPPDDGFGRRTAVESYEVAVDLRM